MSKFTKEMVDLYADKLLIGLTAEENKMILDEFEVIDLDMDIINTIPNISEVEPMAYCLPNLKARLNDDCVEESPDISKLLSNAGATMGREVEVPKVVQ